MLFESTQMLPQAGIPAVLPLVNVAFDSNVLRASFLPSGALSSLDYITEAQAESATAALAEMAGASRQVVQEACNAEIVKLQTRVEELKLQNELFKLRQEQESLGK